MQVGDEIIAVNSKYVNTMKYDDVMNLLHVTKDPVEFQVIKCDVSLSPNSTNNNSDCTSSRASPLVKHNTLPHAELNTKHKLDSKSSFEQDSTTKPKLLPIPSSSDHSITSSSSVLPNNNNNNNNNNSQQPIKSAISSTASAPCSNVHPQSPSALPITKVKHLSFELPENNNAPTSKPAEPPRTALIRVGEETLIEIERGKLGLGLSIVGGSDTQLPGIIIHDIYQNGAAFRDKRLAIGDQILKVNSVDLMNATHDQALSALRQTSEFVKLLIHRGFYPNSAHTQANTIVTSLSSELSPGESASSGYGILNSNQNKHDESFLNIFIIDLNKKFAKGLGFSIIGRRDGSGVFVSHIIDSGCAQKDGRLMIGDLILEVNGQDIRKSSYSDVAFLLKTLPQGKVVLKVGRFKTSANVSLSNSSCVSPAVGSTKTSRRGSITQLNEEANFESQKQQQQQTSTFKSALKK